jgi:NAD(P)-dependent dehydrogenase (short-subunit alcohol dehydrogenase family)
MDVELGGRTAIVTGGASGIGEACARRLAGAGAPSGSRASSAAAPWPPT